MSKEGGQAQIKESTELHPKIVLQSNFKERILKVSKNGRLPSYECSSIPLYKYFFKFFF